MRLCINPYCHSVEWENPVTATNCDRCGCELTIDKIYYVTSLLSNNSGFGTIYELKDAAQQPKVLKVLQQRFND